MMRKLLAVLLVVHGLIHGMGFVKAFGLAEVEALTRAISRPMGAMWLLAGVVLLILAALILFRIRWWWIPGLAAGVFSQVLIMTAWQDAGFGTIPNAVLGVAALLQAGAWSFDRQTDLELNRMQERNRKVPLPVITDEDLAPLPLPVRGWLIRSGIVGKEGISSMSLRQIGLMRLKPDQDRWFKATAVQYVTVGEPAFFWRVSMAVMPFIKVAGRDLFEHGQGRLIIKLLSMITIGRAGGNKKVDQSSLQRYLLELPWYPSAALAPYMKWEAVDDHTAKATMSYGGVTGAATYFFDESGSCIRTSAMRYKDSGPDAPLLECIGEVKELSDINGIQIPTRLEVSWMLETGKFTWYKLQADRIVFNPLEV